ncbi:DUF3238 domain-containing protein [Bacillus sp. DJP31]|uniref:DUF3238 domain-containing protein n=1 Tax=Bacillus sp. DJP31 TaxID=3409789 RepID=UPI003BB65229
MENSRSYTSTSVGFNIYLSASNPCETVAPAIDAVGIVKLYKSSGTVTGTSYLYLEHDGFPAYEIYRKTGSLASRTIYTYNPSTTPGADPKNLFAPLDKAVEVTN